MSKVTEFYTWLWSHLLNNWRKFSWNNWFNARIYGLEAGIRGVGVEKETWITKPTYTVANCLNVNNKECMQELFRENKKNSNLPVTGSNTAGNQRTMLREGSAWRVCSSEDKTCQQEQIADSFTDLFWALSIGKLN